MEKGIRLISLLAVTISSQLIVASAFDNNNPVIGTFALLLSNLACFIAGIVLADD
jgi:hypothetical protein